jgi:hypothetical protein
MINTNCILIQNQKLNIAEFYRNNTYSEYYVTIFMKHSLQAIFSITQLLFNYFFMGNKQMLVLILNKPYQFIVLLQDFFKIF